MSVITFPSTLGASRIAWSQQRRDALYSSVFGSQATEVSAPLWSVALESPVMDDTDANVGQWKALILQLRGKTNQLALWDLARPAPLGTMRGTMTLSGNHAQGATTLVIAATGQTGLTLVAGDMIGVGTATTQQVVMVMATATADGSGITVTVQPPLRNAFTTGAAVTWDKPKALFPVTQSQLGWEYSEGLKVSGFALDLLEDWRS